MGRKKKETLKSGVTVVNEYFDDVPHDGPGGQVLTPEQIATGAVFTAVSLNPNTGKLSAGTDFREIPVVSLENNSNRPTKEIAEIDKDTGKLVKRIVFC